MTLRDAQVRYQPGARAALDGIDLDLPPGRRVALVGPNGAGKSTVAAVLLRFTELTAGAATLNGRDLASYAADDVRTRIGGCPQDPHIFDVSLRDNLRLAKPAAADEQLADAAARAGLLEWVHSLPLGWDTPVGAHGAALSGGQRQRLALARALLADPALLILDEPTAHLDPASRRALTRDLLAATAGRTTLLITHELEGLDQVDEIIVLREGQVAQRGTHAQLICSDDGYRRMWRAGLLVSGEKRPRRWHAGTARSDQLQLAGAADRFAAVSRRQLSVDVPEVGLDGVDGDVHLASDLGRVQHAGHVHQYLPLAVGERLDHQNRSLI